MPIGLEADTLLFKQGALATPTRGCATFFVNYTMAGQRLCSRRITKRAPHHPRMAGPASQSSNMAISSHSSARYLTDDIQHGVAKGTCLFW